MRTTLTAPIFAALLLIASPVFATEPTDKPTDELTKDGTKPKPSIYPKTVETWTGAPNLLRLAIESGKVRFDPKDELTHYTLALAMYQLLEAAGQTHKTVVLKNKSKRRKQYLSDLADVRLVFSYKVLPLRNGKMAVYHILNRYDVAQLTNRLLTNCWSKASDKTLGTRERYHFSDIPKDHWVRPFLGSFIKTGIMGCYPVNYHGKRLFNRLQLLRRLSKIICVIEDRWHVPNIPKPANLERYYTHQDDILRCIHYGIITSKSAEHAPRLLTRLQACRLIAKFLRRFAIKKPRQLPSVAPRDAQQYLEKLYLKPQRPQSFEDNLPQCYRPALSFLFGQKLLSKKWPQSGRLPMSTYRLYNVANRVAEYCDLDLSADDIRASSVDKIISGWRNSIDRYGCNIPSFGAIPDDDAEKLATREQLAIVCSILAKKLKIRAKSQCPILLDCKGSTDSTAHIRHCFRTGVFKPTDPR